MRVLLIGGSGFIGRRVVHRLQQRGHEIIIFHRGETEAPGGVNVQHINGNRLEIDQHKDVLRKLKFDVAIDFLPWGESDTRRVVETLNGLTERVVHLSSGDVYHAWQQFLDGKNGEPLPLDEDAPLRKKFYPYAGQRPGMDDYDKVLAERVIRNAYFSDGYPGVILRLPMMYGPGDGQNRTWPYVKRMLDHRPTIIMSCCQAAWLWQRGYVDDVASAITLAAERQAGIGQVYNVGNLRTHSMRAWVQRIGKALGWAGEILSVPNELLPEDMRKSYNYQQHIIYDTSRIRRDLGYNELIDPAMAIKMTVDWQAVHPPVEYPYDDFDYAAEDEFLQSYRHG